MLWSLVLKLYKIDHSNTDNITDEEIDVIINILKWSNKAFRDGFEAKNDRKIIIKKLKKIKDNNLY